MSTRPPMLKAALAYAKRFGFAVFPCHLRRKEPLTAHGCKDATKDLQAIRRRWESNPAANVSIATGSVSGVFVLDVDYRHGGDETLAALEAEHEKLPGTPTVLTPGGGQHRYFRLLQGVEIRNSVGALGAGLDVRGEGGYVLAPPSVHPNGNDYRWEISSRIDQVAIAEPSSWLLQLISSPQSPPHLASNHTRLPLYRIDFARFATGIPEGERDIELFRLACSLRRRGYPRAMALEVVLDAASRCRPAFPPGSAERKVASAWRYA